MILTGVNFARVTMGLSRLARRAEQDGSHGRRPPSPAAVRRRDPFRRERAGDLAEAPPARELEPDAIGDGVGKRDGTACEPSQCRRGSWLDMLREKTLELVYGNEPLSVPRVSSEKLTY
jgi:hypothetical protein